MTPAAQRIIDDTARALGVRPAAMFGPHKWRDLVTARRVAMWLLGELLGMGVVRIAEVLDCDPSTVTHGRACVTAALSVQSAGDRYRIALSRVIAHVQRYGRVTAERGAA